MDLEAHEIGHRYGDLEVLDRLSFRVGEGRVLAIVGPSGCGKSTLLRILGGLLTPTSGRVSMLGEADPTTLVPVTFVFQDFALLPWRTVAGNVALPLESHLADGEERRRRVDAALDRAGLGDFAAAFPSQLSGGMQQRVGIARALAVRPAVMLMDEPLSALDSQTRHLLRDELGRLWADLDVTTVLVTHDLGEAVALADEVLVLSRRPARVVTAVPIAEGRPARRDDPALLAALEAQLWELVREEAAEADRELM
ncbi:MAG: ABC transporter ATP-binding protein [Thermoanaerobaculia bacterium]|nr:ABC transporter ATP-binding protein [Thermoanaerobaculia bacterium]